MTTDKIVIKGTIDLIDQKYFGAEELFFENITKLPDNLSECKELYTIHISNSNLETFDFKVFELTIKNSTFKNINLEKVVAFVVINSTFDNIIVSNNSELREVSMKECNLTEIPTFFKDCKNIEFLVFNHNDITVIPEWISELKLKTLYLEHNPITIIPESMKKLCECKKLEEFIINQDLLTCDYSYYEQNVDIFGNDYHKDVEI